MADVRNVEFAEALSALQPLLGAEIRVMFHFYETLCGGYLEGPLVRVETTAPGDPGVNLVIGEKGGVLLDPEGLEEIHLAGDLEAGGFLSFYLLRHVEISISRVPGS